MKAGDKVRVKGTYPMYYATPSGWPIGSEGVVAEPVRPESEGVYVRFPGATQGHSGPQKQNTEHWFIEPKFLELLNEVPVADEELAAIQTIVATLEPMFASARYRIVTYLNDRYSLI